jgi:hypothetical protein
LGYNPKWPALGHNPKWQDFGYNPRWNGFQTPLEVQGIRPESGGATDRFGVPSGFGMGVPVQDIDELEHSVFVKPEGSLGVEHVRGGQRNTICGCSW